MKKERFAPYYGAWILCRRARREWPVARRWRDVVILGGTRERGVTARRRAPIRVAKRGPARLHGRGGRCNCEGRTSGSKSWRAWEWAVGAGGRFRTAPSATCLVCPLYESDRAGGGSRAAAGAAHAARC